MKAKGKEKEREKLLMKKESILYVCVRERNYTSTYIYKKNY